MAGHTVVNLKEVEDLAPKFGLSPGLESRFARVPLGLENSGISYFRISSNFRQPFGHRHELQEEVYVLVSGGARMKIEDEFVELKVWDAVRVSPDMARALEASPEGAEVLVFGAPNTGNMDAEALPNWWTD